MSHSFRLVDEARVLRFVDGDRETMVDLACSLLQTAPIDLGRARTAAESQDGKALVFALHKLKSSVSIFTQGPLAAKLDELEQKTMAGDLEPARAELPSLEAEFAALLSELRLLAAS